MKLFGHNMTKTFFQTEQFDRQTPQLAGTFAKVFFFFQNLATHKMKTTSHLLLERI